jgi:predicted dehydrogenase
MLRQERLRPDGIDAVAIMTPNDTHYRFAVAALDAGLDIVGDKPVTHDFREACDLVARTHRGGRIFATSSMSSSRIASRGGSPGAMPSPYQRYASASRLA